MEDKEILEKLRGRLNNMGRLIGSLQGQYGMVNALLHILEKKAAPKYDWRKDKSLSVNKPGYDPEKK